MRHIILLDRNSIFGHRRRKKNENRYRMTAITIDNLFASNYARAVDSHFIHEISNNGKWNSIGDYNKINSNIGEWFVRSCDIFTLIELFTMQLLAFSSFIFHQEHLHRLVCIWCGAIIDHPHTVECDANQANDLSSILKCIIFNTLKCKTIHLRVSRNDFELFSLCRFDLYIISSLRIDKANV